MASLLGSQIQRNLSKSLFRNVNSSSPIRNYHVHPRQSSATAAERHCSRNIQPDTVKHRRSHSQPGKLAKSNHYNTSKRAYFYSTRREEEEEEKEEDVEAEQDVEATTDTFNPDEDLVDKNSLSAFATYFRNKDFPRYDQFKNRGHLPEELLVEAKDKYARALEELYRDDDTKRYRLEATRPQHENHMEITDIVSYYRDHYNRMQAKLLPHLQPSNLKPYGSTDTITYPTNRPEHTKISYPMYRHLETGREGEYVDEQRIKSAHRGYSTMKPKEMKATPTAPCTKDNVKTTNKVARLDGSQTATGQTVANPMAKILQRTQNRNVPPPTPYKKDIGRCNRPIGEFKNVNGDSQMRKQATPPRTTEELQVNSTLQFASKYRKPYLSEESKSTQPSAIPVRRYATKRFGEASSKTGTVEKEAIDVYDEASELLRNQPGHMRIGKQKVLAKPTASKPVSKRNVLQSSAFPGESNLLDGIKAPANVRFTSPWPAYSESASSKPEKKSWIKFPPETNFKLGTNFLDISKTKTVKTGHKDIVATTQAVPKESVNLEATNLAELQKQQYSTNNGNKRHGRSTTKKVTRPELKHDIIYKTRGFYRQSRGTSSWFGRNRSNAISSIARPLYDQCVRHPLEPEATVMPKLRRLKKLTVPSPNRCQPRKKITKCTPRADDGLQVQPKKLPAMEVQECPLEVKQTLKEGQPLVRLREHQTVSKKCKWQDENECHERADDGLQVEQGNLPKLEAGECQTEVTIEMSDCKPLRRLEGKHMPEPSKCVIKGKQSCTRRADDDITPEPKHLPVLEPGKCEIKTKVDIVDVALPRLKKVKIAEHDRMCKNEEVKCSPRADDNTEIIPKELPLVGHTECFGLVPFYPTKSPKLKRLLKVDIPEPVRQCPAADEVCASRADKHLTVEPKSLPVLHITRCPEAETPSLQAGSELLPPYRRYKSRDPERKCPVEIEECHRADDGWTVKPKALPKIATGECPAAAVAKIADVAPLRRLTKRPIPEPHRCRVEKRDICKETPRADDNMMVMHRSLPVLPSFTCPIPEPPELVDISLPRLKKVHVAEPLKVCKVYTYCTVPRADANFEVKEKKLAVLQVLDCPKNSLPQQVEGEPLTRLKKVMLGDPPRCEPKPHLGCEPEQRADSGLRVEPKKLPAIEAMTCPTADPVQLNDGVPLVRLKKRPQRKTKKKCTRIPTFKCSKRADEDLKTTPRKLPTIVAGKCPVASAMTIRDCPPLQRLQKKEIPERKCKKRVRKKCTIPRADDDMVIKQKSLPIIEAENCPSTPPARIVDVSLPRLKKVKVHEPRRVCKSKEEICELRADEEAGYKLKPKQLATLILSQENNKISIREYNRKRYRSSRDFTTACASFFEKPHKVRADVARSVGLLRTQTSRPLYSTPFQLRKCCFKHSLKIKGSIQTNDMPKENASIASSGKLWQTRHPSSGAVHSQKEPETQNYVSTTSCLNMLRSNDCSVPAVINQTEKGLDKEDEETNVVGQTQAARESPSLKSCPFEVAPPVVIHLKIVDGSATRTERCMKRRSMDKQQDNYDEDISAKRFFDCKPTVQETQVYAASTLYKEDKIAKARPSESVSNFSRGKAYYSTKKQTSACGKLAPQKSIWEKICDYFRARPGCPEPGDWKKKKLKDRAEKAAAAAGLFLCEQPPCNAKKPKIRVCRAKGKEPTPPTLPTPSTPCSPPSGEKEKPTKYEEECPRLTLPNCPSPARTKCERDEIPDIPCNPPLKPPYPSFSEYRQHEPAVKINECSAADEKWELERENVLKRRPKKKRACQRNYSTLAVSRSLRYFAQCRYNSERTIRRARRKIHKVASHFTLTDGAKELVNVDESEEEKWFSSSAEQWDQSVTEDV